MNSAFHLAKDATFGTGVFKHWVRIAYNGMLDYWGINRDSYFIIFLMGK
jgi:hypothetical protein